VEGFLRSVENALHARVLCPIYTSNCVRCRYLYTRCNTNTILQSGSCVINCAAVFPTVHLRQRG
jgi:hypothetical protein